MGGAALASICRALIEGGRPRETPAVSVQWGTTTRQRSVTAPLSEIASVARDAGLGTPLLTVIGAVARLHDQIAWFESRPLFGKTVLVTRATHQAGTLSGLLRARGANVIELPVLETVRTMPESDPAVEALAAGEYDWCVFTSANAVEAFWETLIDGGRDARAFRCRLAVIGTATAAAVEAHGIRPDLVAATSTSEGLAANSSPRAPLGAKVLLPKAAETRDVLIEGLRAANAEVTELVVYETRRRPCRRGSNRRNSRRGNRCRDLRVVLRRP